MHTTTSYFTSYTPKTTANVSAECTDEIGQLPIHIQDNIAPTGEIIKKKIESLEET